MNYSSLAGWSDLAHFQLEIAKRWLARGNKSNDVFAKFFFYFAGLNALYYLWARADRIGSKELDRIMNLARKFGDDGTDRVMRQAATSAEYFRNREPIQDMRRRTSDDPGTGSTDTERIFARNALVDPRAAQQLEGLAQTIYFVRSNLVHGSKSTSGDDQELITRSIPFLRALLKEALMHTEHTLGI